MGERLLQERSCSYVAQGQKNLGQFASHLLPFLHLVCIISPMLCPQEYDEAFEAFHDGLDLDPENAELKKVLW